MKITNLVFGFFLSIMLAGCTAGGTVKSRAASDLECAEDKLEVVNIGGYSYTAKGCGKKATYTCQATGNNWSCLKESQEKSK